MRLRGDIELLTVLSVCVAMSLSCMSLLLEGDIGGGIVCMILFVYSKMREEGSLFNDE